MDHCIFFFGYLTFLIIYLKLCMKINILFQTINFNYENYIKEKFENEKV